MNLKEEGWANLKKNNGWHLEKLLYSYSILRYNEFTMFREELK